MASKAYENQKRSLKYSKKRIDKAGRDIRHGCDNEIRQESISIIQNYREVHLFPLMLIKNHLSKTTQKISKKAIVARRLKRLPTIIDKLERPTLDGKSGNAIKLTRMQDIGGCRAIVANLDQLIKLYNKLNKSKSVHKIIKIDDYLTPKDSGYGGIHLIYSCFENSQEENIWKKIKIEVQLRTGLQHAWATSLEIIDTLEGVALKTSLEGHKKWRRFFKIAGQLVAHKEKACEIENSDELEQLSNELIVLEEELNVRRKLFQYRFAIDITTNKSDKLKKLRTHQGMFLVTVRRGATKKEDDEITLDVEIKVFDPKNMENAFIELADNEANIEVMITVLVAAKDVRNLKKAYPNYFGSTNQFTKFLDSIIEPKKPKASNNEISTT